MPWELIVHRKAMKSYLIMVPGRLLKLRRALKPTGSLYLHTTPPPTATSGMFDAFR